MEERKNSAGVLCSLCWRVPLPVALLSPGMDLGAAPGSLDPTGDGSFPSGVDYSSLRMGPWSRIEVWNIRENQPHLFTSLNSFMCCLQQLFPKFP